MATTAKNLRYPTSSDVVNINVDMQNLANDVDNTTAAQTFSATTNGDIITRSSSAQTILSLPTKRIPGSSTWGSEVDVDKTISADSSATSGVLWGANQYPNRHLIASTAISNAVSGTLFTFSSIPQSFQDIEIVYTGVCNGTAGGNNYFYLNSVGDPGGTLSDISFANIKTTVFGQNVANSLSALTASTNQDYLRMYISAIAGTKTMSSFKIFGYSINTTWRAVLVKSHLVGSLSTVQDAIINETLFNFDSTHNNGQNPFPIGSVQLGVTIAGTNTVIQSGTLSLYGIK